MAAAFVPWETKYDTGIEMVDRQHRHLVDLANRLFEACRDPQADLKAGFHTALKESIAYVHKHFSDEEGLMREAAYPELAAHREQHAAFVQQIIASVQDFESGKAFVPNNFVRFLRDWLLEHIAISDKAFARFRRGQ
jgi:hemerythrin